jgi:S1-C subfamily serine protease
VAVLDAELAGLPDAVRAALVSCYYEGLTQDEAARRLGWKVRTVRARVARGRKLLRGRLARRGVDLGAALAAAAVGLDAPAVVPPVSLTRSVGGAASELAGYGLAITGRSVRLPIAIAAAVVAVAGAGYVIGTNVGPASGGPSVAVASSPIVPPTGTPEPPARPQLDFDPAAVYDRAVDGCVYVVRESDAGPVEGTGTLIDREQRLVLTTYRVVGDSDVVSVQFPYHNPDDTIDTNRKEYARSAAGRLTPMGRVIHRDNSRDLALIKLDRLGRHARPMELAEPGVPKAVLHIGAATGELFPMTVRRVLSAAPAMTLTGGTNDSGGPLVDRDGKLAGVVVGEATGPADPKVTRAIGVAEVRAFLAEEDKPIPPPAVPPSAEPPHIPIPTDLGPQFDPIPQDQSPEAMKLYKQVVDSAVFIVTPYKNAMGMGSGSLIDKEKRYILTNYHVVGDQDKVYVQFPVYQKDGTIMRDKKSYIERIPAGQASTGKVLYRDKTRDLAIVQLDKLAPTAKSIKLAKSSVAVGENTWNIGNPGVTGRVFGMTKGTARVIGIAHFVVVGADEPYTIQARTATVTNPIEKADSGSPLVDKNGQLVGVTEGGRSGVGPVSQCIDIIEVRGFLKEKKIVLSDDGPKESPKTKPKIGLDSDRPKIDPPPKKENRTENPPKPDRPAGRGPSPEDERVATVLLQRAKLFQDDEDRAYYKSKLKRVIEQYPGTAAAKEAQKLLDGLKK